MTQQTQYREVVIMVGTVRCLNGPPPGAHDGPRRPRRRSAYGLMCPNVSTESALQCVAIQYASRSLRRLDSKRYVS